MTEHDHVGVAAHGLHGVGQGLALLRGGRGLAKVHDGAAEPLHRRGERAAGPSAHLVEHGGHNLPLARTKHHIRQAGMCVCVCKSNMTYYAS